MQRTIESLWVWRPRSCQALTRSENSDTTVTQTDHCQTWTHKPRRSSHDQTACWPLPGLLVQLPPPPLLLCPLPRRR